MPVPFERMSTGTIIIHDPKYENRPVTPTANGRTVCYARVSSSDQKDDLTRQADRVEGVRPWYGSGEAGNRHRDGFRHERQAAQAQPAIVRPDRGHADRGAQGQARPHERGTGGERAEGQGRRIIVVDDTELDDDLVRDMTEVLTSFCARLYGRRAAKRKTDAALKAARDA